MLIPDDALAAAEGALDEQHKWAAVYVLSKVLEAGWALIPASHGRTPISDWGQRWEQPRSRAA